MKNKLKFEGKSVQIIFSSGSESLYFDYKEEVLGAVKECYEKKKISKHELKKFTEKIFRSDVPSLFKDFFEVTLNFLKNYIEILIEEGSHDFKIENPSFEMCGCKLPIPHGYFIDADEERFSMKIFSKEEAFIYIDELEKIEVITSGDASSLRVIVDLSDFLESPLCN